MLGEWRGIRTLQVTPQQMGFPHVAQLARVDRIREIKGGKQEVETVWIITSLTADQADASRLLELVRLYWTIENSTLQPRGAVASWRLWIVGLVEVSLPVAPTGE